jgi:hypothetical protein
MVRIINYKERQKEDGTTFFVLELQGGIEMVKSKETGNFYATAKRAYISSTFNEQTCSALVGSEMEGQIIKEDCDPFEYTVKETGEEIVLSHRWVYVPEQHNEKSPNKLPQAKMENIKADVKQFSKNGALVHFD